MPFDPAASWGPDDPTAPVIVTPAGWRRIAAEGYVIHADHQVDEPIAFAEAVAAGLEEHPRVLPYRYLYDRRGSEIYEEITAQPEYYPTRTEESILAAHAHEMREAAAAPTLVEFGSGSSAKTRRLIEAWLAAGPACYVPIDISMDAIEVACESLACEYPELQIEAIASTYERAMPLVSKLSPVAFVFLGSSIGNFDNEELDRFFDMIARHLSPGDAILIGIDRVKDVHELEAAYNDVAGWTSAFTRNLFTRMNRELGTRIPEDAVEHVAYYNDRLDRIEIFARFLSEVRIDLPSIDRHFRIAPGEMILTEICRKFRPAEMAATASRFGLLEERLFSDPEERFGVLLLRRVESVPVAENRIHQLRNLLQRVRTRTEEIVWPLTEEQLRAQPNDIMAPLLWDLGHIADFERLWLGDRIEGEGSAGASNEALDPTFDANVHPRSTRQSLDLPTRAHTFAELASVRERSLQLLEGGAIDPINELTRDGFVYRMVAQHESQHLETMLQALQLWDGMVYEPTFVSAQPRRPEARPVERMVLIPGGVCSIGTDDRTIAYDNERPRHEMEIAPFRIDVTPVSNGDMLEFIDDGGYERRELWTDDGWSWVQDNEVVAPAYWKKQGGYWVRRRFGNWVALDRSRPVAHVSWFEANAYARWAGKRLPTEFEWEKAASWDPARTAARTYPWGDELPTLENANLGHRLLEPMPIGSYPRGRSFFGCHQMLGDVYEWTSSDFLPYPGFEAFPYTQYSAVSFGDRYKVLRGASWAVPAFMARNTYRNWDLPERRQIFAGFRCAVRVE